jgi:hypothetical protein
LKEAFNTETASHFSSKEISGKTSSPPTLPHSFLFRWRFNAKEFGHPFSKKGLLRGYIKYGVFAYAGYFYTRKLCKNP